MNLIASLPMYDLPEIRWATDKLWRAMNKKFRFHGITKIPDQLIHDIPVRQLWSDKALFFSQCCGYDVVYGFKKYVKVVATPRFNAPGCKGHDYVSLVVVHADSKYNDISEMFGAVAVVNGCESQSGMNALLSLATPYGNKNEFFSKVLASGSHINSLTHIINKKADVAAIDCVTYTLLERNRPNSIKNTRVLGTTYTAPAPPYITSQFISTNTINRMQAALFDVFSDLRLASARDTLLLNDIDVTTESNYQRICQDFKHCYHQQFI